MKITYIITSFLFPFIMKANGMGMYEDSSVAHQFEEFLPFEHIGHGHYFASVLSIVLWAAFMYMLYIILKNFFLKK